LAPTTLCACTPTSAVPTRLTSCRLYAIQLARALTRIRATTRRRRCVRSMVHRPRNRSTFSPAWTSSHAVLPRSRPVALARRLPVFLTPRFRPASHRLVPMLCCERHQRHSTPCFPAAPLSHTPSSTPTTSPPRTQPSSRPCAMMAPLPRCVPVSSRRHHQPVLSRGLLTALRYSSAGRYSTGRFIPRAFVARHFVCHPLL